MTTWQDFREGGRTEFSEVVPANPLARREKSSLAGLTRLTLPSKQFAPEV